MLFPHHFAHLLHSAVAVITFKRCILKLSYSRLNSNIYDKPISGLLPKYKSSMTSQKVSKQVPSSCMILKSVNSLPQKQLFYLHYFIFSSLAWEYKVTAFPQSKYSSSLPLRLGGVFMIFLFLFQNIQPIFHSKAYLSTHMSANFKKNCLRKK